MGTNSESTTIDNDTTIDDVDNETTDENTEDLEINLPPALQNVEKWEEELDPTTITIDNVRPTNREHVLSIQEGYRTRGGFDDDIEVVAFKSGKKTNYRVLDGHHRTVAIVGSEELGIEGLITDEDFSGELATVTVTVYDGSNFETELDFLITQYSVNTNRRNIDDSNAADQAAAVFRLYSEGASPEQIMAIANKSRAWVSLMLRAHKNSVDELKEAVRNGLISGKSLIDGSMLSRGNQRKMLKQITKETRDLPPREAQKAERGIVNGFVAESKQESGGVPRFPKAINRKGFGTTVFELYSELESNIKEGGNEVRTFNPKGEREEALVQKGIIQGLLYAFGMEGAYDVDYSTTAITRAFKKVTGSSINDVTPWE